MYDNFLFDRSDEIATITLNRPEKRNPINESMLEEFEDIVRILRDDGTTRTVIVTGTGNTFCAGADLSIVKNITEPAEQKRIFARARSRRIRLISRTFGMLENLEQLTIAAVNGFAVGGGWGLALACDFHFSIPGAQYWFPEVDLGVPLSMGSTARLYSSIGAVRAKEVILTCNRYKAEELERWGMINRIFEEKELTNESVKFAKFLLDKPARAATGSKLNVNALSQVLAREMSSFDPDTFIHAQEKEDSKIG
jgi:enoyl-CoA hydratase